MSYLCWLCLSIPLGVWRRAHVLFVLVVFVFTSMCLQEGSCLICVDCVFLYLQVFVGGLMSYLCWLCLSLSLGVCRRAHVLFVLVVFVFTSMCLQEGTCLICVGCVCLYLQVFVGGCMSYLRYLYFFGHSGVQYILCCGFFSSSCAQRCLTHIVLCFCLFFFVMCIAVSNTYCVVFLFVFLRLVLSGV